MKNVENVLVQCREECLRAMDNPNPACQSAWYYTHCGEIEMAGQMGAITVERMNELEAEWRKRKPNGQERHCWHTRADCMERIAQSVMNIVQDARLSKDIDITYIANESAESDEHFSGRQLEYSGILTGDEVFCICDTITGKTLYDVQVTADSELTAAAKLINYIADKF